jgi:hypothetical protein
MDRDRRLSVQGPDETTLDGEGADACQDVAAVLGVRDDGLVDEDLQEQVVHVDARAGGRPDHRHLRGQRVGAAHAVDLARIGRAHHAQKQRIAGGRIGGQIGVQKIAALRGAAPHPHAAHALRHISGHLEKWHAAISLG